MIPRNYVCLRKLKGMAFRAGDVIIDHAGDQISMVQPGCFLDGLPLTETTLPVYRAGTGTKEQYRAWQKDADKINRELDRFCGDLKKQEAAGIHQPAPVRAKRGESRDEGRSQNSTRLLQASQRNAAPEV